VVAPLVRCHARTHDPVAVLNRAPAVGNTRPARPPARPPGLNGWTLRRRARRWPEIVSCFDTHGAPISRVACLPACQGWTGPRWSAGRARHRSCRASPARLTSPTSTPSTPRCAGRPSSTLCVAAPLPLAQQPDTLAKWGGAGQGRAGQGPAPLPLRLPLPLPRQGPLD
jgi:hypothetical protein